MGIIDISGKINIGMWSYGDPFPEFDLQRVPTPEWLDYPIYSEIFSGMNSQSGTYLETPAHLLGYEKSYPLDKVALENLVDIPTCVIQLDYGKLPRSDDRPVVTLEALSSSATADDLAGARAVCISTGWGRKWNDEDFVEASPFIKYDAMEWLVDRKPFLVCSDSPRWENLEHPEGFFPMFYQADILMLTPCVNLERIRRTRVTLTALPLPILDTCCTPCRAFVREED